MRQIFLILIIVLFSCSDKYVPKYSSKSIDCDCINYQRKEFELNKSFWMKNNAEPYRRHEWERFFDNVEKRWNELGLSEIGPNEYRLSVFGSFGSIRYTSIKLVDSITEVVVKELHEPIKKAVVSTVKLIYSDSVFSAVNEKMDSIFWGEAFKNPFPISVSDGSSYYFEGYIDGDYKMIERASGGISNCKELLNQFNEFDFLIGGYHDCLNRRINCN